MPNRPSALLMVSVLWLLNSAIGVRLAISEDLPAEWVAGLYVGRDASEVFFRGSGRTRIAGAAGLTVLGAGGP